MPDPVPPNPPPKRPPVDPAKLGAPRMPTRLESADEIRAAIQARLGGGNVLAPVVPTLPQQPTPVPASSPPVAAAAVHLFKPTERPPIALLHVFDDGTDEGEIIRLRGDRVVIGRSEGDLLLPHDGLVSAKHAELVRHQEEDKSWVWVLSDLGSTNGTFVRAGAAPLKDGQEFIIGRTRYRFEAGENQEPVADAPGSPKGTIAWNSAAGVSLPSIVELAKTGPGATVPLLQTEYWIGSDASACAIVAAPDPFASPRHARIHRDAKNRWHIANNKSANGVWVRIEQMDLASSCQFQIGEQRFSFKVP
jgi:pSer/pThr/pTyr-binding forkhead associated (FHA) protein